MSEENVQTYSALENNHKPRGIKNKKPMEKTLRDEFAIAALPALITDYFAGNRNNEYSLVENWQEGLAIDAYRIADAMIAARNTNRS